MAKFKLQLHHRHQYMQNFKEFSLAQIIAIGIQRFGALSIMPLGGCQFGSARY